MNKQKWLYNQVVFTIAMVFVVCCLLSSGLWAAKKIDFYTANAQEYIRLLNENDNRDDAAIGPLFGLTPDEKFTLLRQSTDFNHVTHSRYQQLYKGFPVWGTQIVISRDSSNKVLRLHGAMIQGSPNDVKDIPFPLDALAALRQMQERHRENDKGAVWNFRNEKYGAYIYLDKNEKAHLCYVVSFFADTDCGNPSRPIFFIDAKSGKIIDSFDSLTYAFDGTGPGGNLKVGYYYYGTDYPKFGVSISGSTCTMNWADCKTVDLNHGTSGTTPYSYTCYENTHENINGGYCPMNDAQFFGQQIYNMYQDWYGLPVLPFQLMMRCHYSTNYENAFWDGKSMTFGDGYTTFYPLVALDVSSHEVAHGFTENNSGLIYSGQSGGINESYSDVAGEAAEYYTRGTNDFMCGYDIFKAAGQALKYLYDPHLDGQSIDHVCEYYEGMDGHYSSGIFNKAFYLIATTPGWTTKMAFDIFVKANMDYWTPDITFQQGAQGVLDAASDYGYSCPDTAYAFAFVGIALTCPEPIYCQSSGCNKECGYIAGVQVGDLNNPSGPSHYSDFTNMAAHLTQGETVDVELTPGFPGSAYPEYWKIWIDYNDDHDFADTSEEVFSGSGSSVVTGIFTVPCSVIVGDTRMRVSMKYGGYPTPCGTFTCGEVEDYTVNITSGTGTINNPGFETGTTGWTEIGNVSITNDSRTGSYAVRLDEDNSSVEQVVCVAPNTSYTISCWAKAKNNAKVYLGAKNYGGDEKTVQVKDNNYNLQEVTFTTGATNYAVTIFFIKKNSNNNEPGTADDFAMVTN